MRQIIQHFWKENLIVVCLILGAGIATTVASFINAAILNALVALDSQKFILNMTYLIIVYGFFLVATYFQMKQLEKTTQKMSNYLRFKILGKITTMSPKQFREHNEGHYTSWLSNDINQIEQLGFEKFYELLSGVVNLILSVIGLVYIHWSILIVTLIEVILIIQLPNLFGKKIEQATEKITVANEQSMSKTSDFLSGFSTFYVFNNLSYLMKEIKNEFLNLEEKKNLKSFIMAKVQILGAGGNLFGQVSIYALSGFLIFTGKISIGMINTSASFSSRIFNTVGNLSYFTASIKSIEPLIQKINQFSEVPVEVSNNTNPIGELNQGIELSHLSFEYDASHPVLDDVTFQFELNKKYAIDGESGAGKSTILNLLTKDLSPTEGKVLINGIDLSKIDSKELLSCVTYIEQKPFVFNGTIRDNISLGDSFDDQAIKDTLDYVGLSHYGDKLDDTISENGGNFSGGQKQRLALARGLVRQNKIILLDESTSSLDKETARSIENYILEIPDVTVIMISHHLTEEIKSKLDDVLLLKTA